MFHVEGAACVANQQAIHIFFPVNSAFRMSLVYRVAAQRRERRMAHRADRLGTMAERKATAGAALRWSEACRSAVLVVGVRRFSIKEGGDAYYIVSRQRVRWHVKQTAHALLKPRRG